jgi:phosphatidylserine/phosphatidylglycerophosphate/cardiolipin synthase-like enzyme
VTEEEAIAEAQQLAGKWFAPSVGRISSSNDVTAYIEGADAFREIADLLASAEVDATSFVLLLGWSCHLDFELKPGDAATTMRKIFAALDARGTSIRSMLWKNTFPGFDNGPAVTYLQSLKYADAILDNRTAIAGSHHQKILIVYGKTRTIGFCGGMDLYPDRINASGFAPLHDVHWKIEGPACSELLTIFLERWNDHPSHQQKFPDDLRMPSRRAGVVAGGTYAMQVGRTYPNLTYLQNRAAQWGYGQLIAMLKKSYPNALQNIPPTGDMNDASGNFKAYAFTRGGERGVWGMIERGIAVAQNFVYAEDQYLVGRAASTALANKLRLHQRDKKFRVIILICHTSLVDLQQAWERRREFVADLVAADPSRTMWSICYRSPVGAPKSYVHSKTWVFDDEFAITGSANCSRRSFTEDSECDVGVVGRPGGTLVKSGKTASLPSFAQSLRCALWSKHLGRTPADWSDAMATASAWFSPPRIAHVARYDERAGTDKPSPELMQKTDVGYQSIHDLFWQYVLDPDGV